MLSGSRQFLRQHEINWGRNKNMHMSGVRDLLKNGMRTGPSGCYASQSLAVSGNHHTYTDVVSLRRNARTHRTIIDNPESRCDS